MGYFWPIVSDAGSALTQHGANGSCLLGTTSGEIAHGLILFLHSRIFQIQIILFMLQSVML